MEKNNITNKDRVQKEQIPALKLQYIPPDKFGYDTIGAVNQYCNYQRPKEDKQPNSEWVSNNNSYHEYPGNCEGIINNTNKGIENLSLGKNNSCGKTIVKKDSSNIRSYKSDGLGLLGKEPKCCNNIIKKGILPENKSMNFNSPTENIEKNSPSDYTSNNQNNPTHSKVAGKINCNSGNCNGWFWGDNYYRQLKSDYKFTKKNENGVEIPLSNLELVENSKKHGLKSIGHVFLNEHGLIVDSKGKCCDPKLYHSNNENKITNLDEDGKVKNNSCGSGCSEMNILSPIDFDHYNIDGDTKLDLTWKHVNECSDIGFKNEGGKFTTDCLSNAYALDNNKRDALQYSSWIKTRTDNKNVNETIHYGQIKTCVRDNIESDIRNSIKKANISMKKMKGDEVADVNSLGERTIGKRGLVDNMSIMINNEYRDLKDKEINNIKAAAETNSKYFKRNYFNNEKLKRKNIENNNYISPTEYIGWNPKLSCPNHNQNNINSINKGDCILPNFNNQNKIENVINKFKSRNNCGINNDSSCLNEKIDLHNFILGDTNSSDFSTHWDNIGNVDCSDVCYCYPINSDGKYECNENDPNCPYRCSCIDAKNKGCTNSLK